MATVRFTEEDLVEVISVFKCRFCQFTASTPQNVKSHVTSNHMTRVEDVTDTSTSMVASLQISTVSLSSDRVILEDNNGLVSGLPGLSQAAPGEVVSDNTSEILSQASTAAGIMSTAEGGESAGFTAQASTDGVVLGQVFNAEEEEIAVVPGYDTTTLATDDQIILEYTDVDGAGDNIQVSVPGIHLKPGELHRPLTGTSSLGGTGSQGGDSQVGTVVVSAPLSFSPGELLSVGAGTTHTGQVGGTMTGEMAGSRTLELQVTPGELLSVGAGTTHTGQGGGTMAGEMAGSQTLELRVTPGGELLSVGAQTTHSGQGGGLVAGEVVSSRTMELQVNPGDLLSVGEMTGSQTLELDTIQSLVGMDTSKSIAYSTAQTTQAMATYTQTGGAIGLPELVSLPGGVGENLSLQQSKVFTGIRELFLCGQCNTGFVSMDECKVHIEQNHMLSLTTTETETDFTISEPDNPAPNKHSLGIQASGVSGRKRGRKRKEDTVDREDTEPRAGAGTDSERAEKQQGELAEEASFGDDYRTDLSSVRRVSSRAVKIPRYLLSEYYVGQKKPMDKNTQTLGEKAEQIATTKRRKKWTKNTEMECVVLNEAGLSPSGREGVGGEASPATGAETVEVEPEGEHSPGGGAEDTGDSMKLESGEARRPTAEVTSKEPGLATPDLENRDTDKDYTPSATEDLDVTDVEDSPKKKQHMLPIVRSDPSQVTPDSIYPTEEELLGVKMSGKRNPYGQRVTQKFEIEEGMKTQKHKYTIKCKYKTCRGRFLSKETHETHLKCHRRRPARGGLVCYECDQTFNSWSTCKYHLWREHRVDLDLYKCDQCDFRTDMTCKMDLHKVVHREDRPYACRECGRGFKQPAQLRNHEVLHEQLQEMDERLSPQESKQWFHKQVCDICDKEFANSKTLRNHQMVVHGRLRPFLCPHCDHSASTRGALQLHIRTHTGEKPFQCDQCQFSSSDHNTLRRHRMRHTGEKPYKCPHCSYSCIQSVSIKSHIQYKHADHLLGLYKCTSCDFNSVNQRLYLAHMSDHEKGLIPATGISKSARKLVNKKRPEDLQSVFPQQTSILYASDNQSPEDPGNVFPQQTSTLYACAQCSYTSPSMATLISHLISHKNPSAPSNTAATAVIPSNDTLPTANVSIVPSSFKNAIKGIVLDGSKEDERVFQLRPVSDGVTNVIPTLQVLSGDISTETSVDGFVGADDMQQASDSRSSFEVPGGNGLITDGMVANYTEESGEQVVVETVHPVASGSDYLGGSQVTYVDVQSMEQAVPASLATGVGEIVYTLKPTASAGEKLADMVYTLKPPGESTERAPLQLLENNMGTSSVEESTTFVCTEDGRLEPVNLADFTEGQMSLGDANKPTTSTPFFVQDAVGTQVFVQQTAQSSVDDVLLPNDEEAGSHMTTHRLVLPSEESSQRKEPNDESNQVENLEGATDLSEKSNAVPRGEMLKQESVVGFSTQDNSGQISMEIVSTSEAAGGDIAMVTVSRTENVLEVAEEMNDAHSFL